MIYVINLIFHGDFDAIVFISIWLHQDGLERREWHPGGVQKEKHMFPLWTCDTYMLLLYFFMVNTMEISLFWFGVTRTALNTEKDILVKYSKRNLCFHYGRVIHFTTLFFMENIYYICFSCCTPSRCPSRHSRTSWWCKIKKEIFPSYSPEKNMVITCITRS